MKKYLFTVIILMCVCLTSKVETKAAFIGEEALAGYSKLLSLCEAKGINPADFLPKTYEVTEEELEILYRITEAEVTGEGDEQYLEAKKNVVSCIFARLEHGWAKDIKGVVFQKKQFSPISDGRYYTVKVTQQTKDAVDWVVKYGKTHDCQYFCTRTCQSAKTGYHSKLDFQFFDGEHNYYK